MSSDNNKYGDVTTRIRAVREAFGYTQKKLCAAIDMPLPSLRDYELGKRIPGGDALEKFSRAGVNLHWLVTGQGEMFMPDHGQVLAVEIALAIKASGKGFEELLPALGLSDDPITLTEYLVGKRRPDSEFLTRLAEVTGYPETALHNAYNLALALDTMSTSMNEASIFIADARAQAAKEAALPPVVDEAGYAAIPLYDVRAAAGGGAVVDQEQAVDFLHFKQEWIRQELRASPSDLYLIYVDGESMEPTLRPGDIILVDHRDQAQARDGVYVLRLDGTLLVKRLQKLPGGIIEVTSDNPAYKSFTLKLAEMKEQNFDIIGRVVWTGRRM